MSHCGYCKAEYAGESKEILDEIAHALESRGYAGFCNGKSIGRLIDDLENAEEMVQRYFRLLNGDPCTFASWLDSRKK